MTVYENIELITGKGGSNHIDSEDFGAYQAATYGTGCYILSGCGMSLDNSNAIIAAGELLLEGRHVRVKPPGATIAVDAGVTGYKRADLICMQYTCDPENDNVEATGLVYLRGTPTTGASPVDPTYTAGSILAGATTAVKPLYRVTWNGPSATITRLLPITRPMYEAGGALACFPVGSIFTTVVNTNPASFLGGTWAAFGSGRCLVGVDTSQTEFSTVQKTGGHKALQKHSHTIAGSGKLRTANDGKHSHKAVGYIKETVAAGKKYSRVVSQSSGSKTGTMNTDSEAAHAHDIASHSHSCADAGTGTAGNLQPYITVFFWRRTA